MFYVDLDLIGSIPLCGSSDSSFSTPTLCLEVLAVDIGSDLETGQVFPFPVEVHFGLLLHLLPPS